MTVSIFNKNVPMTAFEIEKLPPASQQDLLFDQNVLKRVVKVSSHLESISLDRMSEINVPARQALSTMLLKMFEVNQNTLLRLSLFKFSDVIADGEEILNFLANCKIISLERLDLGGNPNWYTTEQAVANLGKTIQNQKALQVLCLGNESMLSSEATLTVMRAIKTSSSLNTLRLLDLSHCNWDN